MTDRCKNSAHALHLNQETILAHRSTGTEPGAMMTSTNKFSAIKKVDNPIQSPRRFVVPCSQIQPNETHVHEIHFFTEL
ncbi:hypothetical protein DPMN_007148 [Dreissena polymorpha]|uniref:Uncharacterized protein n=1 Tax=Dreissena polymorpha TaxID=45954 RepID=A0A9D4MVZ8_DREPO|nr:hypothetical protein DPMN_007148 [Dreissena polymorpha]